MEFLSSAYKNWATGPLSENAFHVSFFVEEVTSIPRSPYDLILPLEGHKVGAGIVLFQETTIDISSNPDLFIELEMMSHHQKSLSLIVV